MSWFDFLESTWRPNRQTSPVSQQNRNGPGLDDETDHCDEATSNSGYHEELHPNTPFIFGFGPGFIDIFNSDPHAEKRKENLYYPFSSKDEWGLASWLLCSGLSMRAIDSFLALHIVSRKVHEIISF